MSKYGYPLMHFSHASKRLKERYELSVSWEEWSAWCDAVENGDGIATQIPSLSDGEDGIWAIKHIDRLVFLGVRDGRIRTVLPKKTEYLTEYSKLFNPQTNGKAARRLRHNYDMTELHRWADDGGNNLSTKDDRKTDQEEAELYSKYYSWSNRK